ncbi:MAG: MBOAT family protein [Lachnospiraceae bacterium]|nr:MBOAT family protein [Lachnospiraceae bacterium]
MVFSSLEFIFYFLPVFLMLYYAAPKTWRNGILFIGSICFYAMGEPRYVLLLMASIVINYLVGRGIFASTGGLRRFCFLAGLLFDIGLLVFFKYNWVLEESVLLPGFLTGMPLGISFYSFQIISYLVDVYVKKTPAEKSVITLGTYLCMFPQLIAGPIVTYPAIAWELQDRKLTLEKMEDGLHIFVLGLASKVLLANRIGILWHQVETIGFDAISTPLAWMGAFAFSFQLYFDFLGYSLMAIGLGKMLGFHLPANFNNPYMAKSMTEFWEKWHITLGTWFRDYVYIPLGGNRKGTVRTIRNLLVVWMLTGIWHGASLNFVLWGLFLFICIVLEKFVWKATLENVPVLGHLYMLFLIPVSWMLFAITEMDQIVLYFSRLFPFGGWTGSAYHNALDFVTYLQQYGVLFLLCFLFSTTALQSVYQKYKNSILMSVVLLGLFWLSVYYLKTAENNPFLYYRF